VCEFRTNTGDHELLSYIVKWIFSRNEKKMKRHKAAAELKSIKLDVSGDEKMGAVVEDIALGPTAVTADPTRKLLVRENM
jgi:hypothetical protein